jgi:two-component system chemotaxis sensor kinase CheA
MSKYRAVFLEEAVENLSEMSGALLELEKDTGCSEAIDLAFRMAHSIKGMAASLEYDSITEVAHRLEDCLQEIRSAGRVKSPEGLSLLFKGLEGLEAMVATVRKTGEPPPPNPDLAAVLASPADSPPPDAAVTTSKKVRGAARSRRVDPSR